MPEPCPAFLGWASVALYASVVMTCASKLVRVCSRSSTPLSVSGAAGRPASVTGHGCMTGKRDDARRSRVSIDLPV